LLNCNAEVIGDAAMMLFCCVSAPVALRKDLLLSAEDLIYDRHYAVIIRTTSHLLRSKVGLLVSVYSDIFCSRDPELFSVYIQAIAGYINEDPNNRFQIAAATASLASLATTPEITKRVEENIGDILHAFVAAMPQAVNLAFFENLQAVL
jgi:hypothetical protein